ncbi:fatty acid oxidation complex subunit alpha FadB [Marinobacterium weihaiense]|uniref:enoyl-CoA hydratase n=1 Tax=Marinobacterium weihaiense TaxID=2851016 RepID=A0ABS6MB98_9GAMM|nr:fatty acid oxidation complex subunit alpha FadB [Marinobacterium weihaiense]MBV0933592.1 fatty acid oxidation complex subunit alpha FadB [Marinobacterium weihaiense]
MMYSGESLKLRMLDNGIGELVFHQAEAPVNTLNQRALTELGEVVEQLQQDESMTGLLISSAKSGFIAGADITEFPVLSAMPDARLQAVITATQRTFATLEQLPFPSVVIIGGAALGGGLELALSADFRVLADDARLGLPEVGLGICPAWGGTVRLSRLLEPNQALQWLLSGRTFRAEAALNDGVADQVVPAEQLREAGLALLQRAIEGEVNVQRQRQRKRMARPPEAADSIQLEGIERLLQTHYPAPEAILKAVRQHLSLPFEAALQVEVDTFVQLAHGDVARSLVGLFMNNQLLQRKARRLSQAARPVRQAAVLGAGVMGSEIACQSARSGVPVVLKDINDAVLERGMQTIRTLLQRQVSQGRLAQDRAERIQAGVAPLLSLEHHAGVDLVVEAVVEQADIKSSVLAEVEQQLDESAVLATNTSTLSIDRLATGLSRPEQFCGLHFFNPVHRMPLIEVVRGRRTSESTLATAVAYATALGKTPIVVNDGPGFLVNRILFPYFNAFNRLLLDGVDFERIDRVMESFGWPMGPARLADVVGLDVLVHADTVLQAGFPDRMQHAGPVIAAKLSAAGMLGCKSGQGFYCYERDADGRPVHRPAPEARALVALEGAAGVTDQVIRDRLMVPLCLEAVRCLEDGIVETAAEVDMGLVLGLGFPRFRGGALRYIDTLGLETFASRARALQHLGPLYQLPAAFRARLARGRRFYQPATGG